MCPRAPVFLPGPMKVGVVVHCALCGQMKIPIGRSGPLGASYCDDDCAGYRQLPYAGSLWPGEREADFGYPVGTDGTVDAVDPQADANSGCPRAPESLPGPQERS